MMDAETRRIERQEIGFIIIATSEYGSDGKSIFSVRFDVWEHFKDGSQDCDPKERFLSGYVKWDGCSNWQVPADHNMPWHFCSVKQAENVGKLFRQMYEIASTMLPQCDFEDEVLVGEHEDCNEPA